MSKNEGESHAGIRLLYLYSGGALAGYRIPGRDKLGVATGAARARGLESSMASIAGF